MKRVGVLPALVTIANGYCGLLSVYKTHDGDLDAASWLILLAMVFDVLDGKIARFAGSTTRFGAYLDSLCDAISFGVAPALLAKAVGERFLPDVLSPKLLTIATALFALGALLRLARYNLEHASAGEGMDPAGAPVAHFDGLPTPGAAGVVASLVYLANVEGGSAEHGWPLRVVAFFCPVLGYLMVSRIKYVHFGNRFLRGRRDFAYLFLVVVAVAAVTRFPRYTLPVAFLGYGVSGPVFHLLRRARAPEAAPEPPEAP